MKMFRFKSVKPKHFKGREEKNENTEEIRKKKYKEREIKNE